MAQFCGVCRYIKICVKPETQLLCGDAAKNMPDSLSTRTRLHLKSRWKLQLGGEAELAFLFGPVDWHIAAEQHAPRQPFGLRAIGDGIDDSRAEERES